MLQDIFSAFREYWYLTLALVIAMIVTVFAWIKLIKSSKVRGARRDEIIRKLKEENELRQKFAELTADKLAVSEPSDIIRGMALNIQRKLEGYVDMNTAFSDLSSRDKYIYAFNYLFFDETKTLSDFFRTFGKPLTPIADEAVRLIIGGEFADNFHLAFRIFDSDEEEFSVTGEAVSDVNKRYAEHLEKNSDAIFAKIKEYLINELSRQS